jgi:hypothetical protein
VNNLGRRFPDDYTIAELHAIATRALANGDDYAKALLREQLKEEEFDERAQRPQGRLRLYHPKVTVAGKRRRPPKKKLVPLALALRRDSMTTA